MGHRPRISTNPYSKQQSIHCKINECIDECLRRAASLIRGCKSFGMRNSYLTKSITLSYRKYYNWAIGDNRYRRPPDSQSGFGGFSSQSSTAFLIICIIWSFIVLSCVLAYCLNLSRTFLGHLKPTLITSSIHSKYTMKAFLSRLFFQKSVKKVLTTW